MMKLGKTGGKRGLAITGMILGIIATILSAMLVMGIGKIQSESAKFGDEFGDQFKEAMEQGMQQGFDSMAVEMEQAVDSAATQQ
ncbi:MAG: hypothetical protein IPH89_11510 [Bacteroidetes bacterium]|nr:hypothetical protein [Bacteroidota bacterium]